MLVYCSRLLIVPDTPTSDVLAPIANWLARKTGTHVEASGLEQSVFRPLSDGSRYETTVFCADGMECIGVRYSHPDRSTKGREWIAEIGVRRDASELSCSTLLRTDEKSALVVGAVETTRPVVVGDIANACKLAADCPGGSVRSLTLDDAEAFAYLLSDPGRQHAIVQLSALQDGRFVVNAQRLASLLLGIADVVTIPPDVDTFALEDRLGARHSCYHGAVNIIWPPARSATGIFIPNTRLMAGDLLQQSSGGRRVESFLLAAICHRSNNFQARRHLSPEAVHSLGLRHSVETARKSGAKSEAEFADLLRQVDHDQQSEIKKLKEEVSAWENEAASLYQERDTLRDTVDALKQSIAAIPQASVSSQSCGLDQSGRRLILETCSDKFTLERALQIIQLLFGDRVVVLENAWSSARSADEFKYSNKAFTHLATLCGDYYDAVVAGKSDAEVRGLLGNAYSARESETVEKNKRARKLRTFTYKGQAQEMMAHLRIGTKPSRHETWRCHFHWDASEKKIVIGHCGEHLDHN